MKILTHRTFDRAFRKLQPKLQGKLYQTLKLYAEDKTDERLYNHALTGAYFGYRSINLTGDYRIIFEEIDSETIRLVNVGTHSQLYGK